MESDLLLEFVLALVRLCSSVLESGSAEIITAVSSVVIAFMAFVLTVYINFSNWKEKRALASAEISLYVSNQNYGKSHEEIKMLDYYIESSGLGPAITIAPEWLEDDVHLLSINFDTTGAEYFNKKLGRLEGYKTCTMNQSSGGIAYRPGDRELLFSVKFNNVDQIKSHEVYEALAGIVYRVTFKDCYGKISIRHLRLDCEPDFRDIPKESISKRVMQKLKIS